MKPDSRELADRIDVLLAFQDNKTIQYRVKKAGKVWNNAGNNLIFNFARYQYRVRPAAPQEGWVRRNDVHKRVAGCQDECTYMRETEGEQDESE